MKKRIFSMLLVLCMVMCTLPSFILPAAAETAVWDGTVDTSWYTKSPSAPSYTITTAAQLAGLIDLVNTSTQQFAGRTIYLGADIRLNDTTNWSSWSNTTAPANSWLTVYYSIGESNKAFQGVFDGQNHIVEGLYNINNSEDGMYPIGLFPALYGATVKNLHVIKSYVCSIGSAGSIAGFAGNSTIQYCTNRGTVSRGDNGNGAGGIVGGLSENAVVDNCQNYGMIFSPSVFGSCGGIAGCMRVNPSITNCQNYGMITGSRALGGILGISYDGTGSVKNCISAQGLVPGAINNIGSYSDSFIGHIIGYIIGADNIDDTGSSSINGGNIGISPSAVTLSTNSTQVFTPSGIVAGDTVVWSVSGNTSSSTKVNNGVLSVASDETATSFSVKVTVTSSDGNPQGFAVSIVTIDKRILPTAAQYVFNAPTDLIYNGQQKKASFTKSSSSLGDITAIYYSADNGATWSTDAPREGGTYQVKIDVAGNTTLAPATLTSSNWTFQITYLPTPTPAYTLGGGILSNGIYWARAQATLSAPSTYTMVNSDGTTFIGNVLTDTAANSISFRLKDMQGHITKAISVSEPIRIDGVAPVISAVTGNPSDWTNQKVTLTVAASDAKVGLAAQAYSFDNGSTWQTDPSKDFTANQTVYIKARDALGNVSKAYTVDIQKIDTQAPTGLQIKYNTNSFRSFLNTITFGVFFKQTVSVTAQATDTLSGIAGYSYFASDREIVDFSTVSWSKSLSLEPNSKKLVYVKATDNAGNICVDHEGVVVYTDSTQKTAELEFIRTSTTDLTANVNLNGNTVKEIKNGSTVIDSANYSVNGGTITFKASYLDTLEIGNYTLAISYNPLGESYVDGANNQEPGTTSIALAVKAKTVTDNNGNLNSSVTVDMAPKTYVYTGTAFAPTVTVKDGTKTLSASKDYTVSWTPDMTNVGEKIATITFKGIYAGIATQKVNVTNATLTDTTNKTQSTIYTGNAQSIKTLPSATTVNNQAVTVKYSNDGKNYTLTSAPSFTDQGNYTVYYQLSAPNHTTVTGQIAFAVKVIKDNAIINLALDDWAYGDKPNTPTATATYGTPVFTYSDRESGIYTSTVPTEVGTYYVKASVAATEDYKACEATKSFTISKKAISAGDLTISGIRAFYLFTNSAIEPKPVVKYGDKTLVLDTDYTLSYKNNIAIGTNAKVIVALKGNYSGTGEKTFEIRYGKPTEDEIKNMITLPDFNSNGWHKEDIVITKKDGFALCKTPTGTFGNTLTISEESSKTGTDYTFYIKATDGSVYERTMNYKLDKTNPIGLQVQYQTNGFKDFLHTITFGMFFKQTVDVTAQATDALSGIAGYSYFASDREIVDFSTVSWSKSLSLEPNSKKLVYVKATDNAGNICVDHEGVVVYTDSTQKTADVTFIRTSTTDLTANVNLNGNTIKEIRMGGVAVSSANYSVNGGTITFKASYLDTLAVGDYVVTISYNPLGESYVDGANNQEPGTTSLALAVKAKTVTDGNGNLNSSVTVDMAPKTYVYTGTAFAPTVTVKDGTKTLAVGTDYTVSWTPDMTNVGEKIATITFQGIYAGIATQKVNVTNATLTDTTNKTQSTIYTGNAQSIPNLPSATTVNNQAVTVKYSNDGKNYTLTSAPSFTDQGNYTVYYQLSAPNHTTVTGQIAFAVKKATDNAITNLALKGWTYGDAANKPSANAKFGSIQYTYSNQADGDFTTTIPTQAGIYFVKASVEETANYNGCEAQISFEIAKKQIASPDITVSGIEPYYLFTNQEIRPEPIVNADGKVLQKGTDYLVSYADNIAIGTNAKVIVTLKGNYSGSVQKTFEIRYGKPTEDEIKNMITLPDFNSNGWHKEDIVITAQGEWSLCTTPTGTFANTLTISEESSKTGTDYTFYIKATDGSVYERTMNYKLDKGAPEGSITIGNSTAKDFVNSITFGLLFHKDVDVTVSSSDTLSGIAKMEVYKSDAELTKEQLSSVDWIEYTTVITERAKDKDKFIYYVRITDNAGNVVMIHSQGASFDLTPPVSNDGTNGETNHTNQTDSPHTGVTGNMALWVALLLVSGGSCGILCVNKKRKKTASK